MARGNRWAAAGAALAVVGVLMSPVAATPGAAAPRSPAPAEASAALPPAEASSQTSATRRGDGLQSAAEQVVTTFDDADVRKGLGIAPLRTILGGKVASPANVARYEARSVTALGSPKTALAGARHVAGSERRAGDAPPRWTTSVRSNQPLKNRARRTASTVRDVIRTHLDQCPDPGSPTSTLGFTSGGLGGSRTITTVERSRYFTLVTTWRVNVGINGVKVPVNAAARVAGQANLGETFIKIEYGMVLKDASDTVVSYRAGTAADYDPATGTVAVDESFDPYSNDPRPRAIRRRADLPPLGPFAAEAHNAAINDFVRYLQKLVLAGSIKAEKGWRTPNRCAVLNLSSSFPQSRENATEPVKGKVKASSNTVSNFPEVNYLGGASGYATIKATVANGVKTTTVGSYPLAPGEVWYDAKMPATQWNAENRPTVTITFTSKGGIGQRSFSWDYDPTVRFDVEITGTQTTTWDYDYAEVSDGHCASTDDWQGYRTVTFQGSGKIPEKGINGGIFIPPSNFSGGVAADGTVDHRATRTTTYRSIDNPCPADKAADTSGCGSRPVPGDGVVASLVLNGDLLDVYFAHVPGRGDTCPDGPNRNAANFGDWLYVQIPLDHTSLADPDVDQISISGTTTDNEDSAPGNNPSWIYRNKLDVTLTFTRR
ncbi:hypothetical protein [Nocardioides stalactiti]|uniref:hypothetical protein n=1 Tax=Nocardioides stalactiti TaxID=2755356 RepID=UPI0016036636|nr:hypothetical protein [Nocardioides stalactiti]